MTLIPPYCYIAGVKEINFRRNKMKIAILGSTGFAGKILLAKALEKDYQVKTLVRDPQKLGIYKERVEFISGSASESDKLEKTVIGTEAILSTLPPIINTNEPEKYAGVMKDLVMMLERNAIKRLIHIGGAVHGGGTNENWTLGRKLLRFYLNIVCKPILIAKQLEWEVLRKSNLDWILVRPPRITKDKPIGHLIADERNLASVQVNVEDLTEFILDQLNSGKWVGKAPLVATVSQ
jgi:putative NADH-flavin reductase